MVTKKKLVDIECSVCGQDIVTERSNLVEDNDEKIIIKEFCCSDECKSILKRTLNNLQPRCGECNAPVDLAQNNRPDVFDFETEQCFPVCQKCLGDDQTDFVRQTDPDVKLQLAELLIHHRLFELNESREFNKDVEVLVSKYWSHYQDVKELWKLGKKTKFIR